MPAGTITLTNDSNIAKGSGTSFSAEFASGDVLASTVGEVTYTLFIKSVDSDTQVTLVKNYDGPTATGLAWSAIPRNVAIAIPAQIATEVSKALRGLNQDKSNWQQVFSSSGIIAVTLPDGSSFSGPSWQYMASMFANKADLSDGAVAISQGGTGATTQSGAREALGLGSAALKDTGSSGETIPLLNGANTWTAKQIINAVLAINETGSGGGGSIELGNLNVAGSAYLDFHSSGGPIDYDARILCEGGSSTASANGIMTAYGSEFRVNTGIPLSISSGSSTANLGSGTDASRSIFAGADSASFDSASNINLSSWYGIGFCTAYTSPSNGVVAGKPAAFINTRNGNFYARNAVYANTTSLTSDRNAKKDIVEIDDALSMLAKLKAYTFEFKSSGQKSAGLIAQEAQDVFPDFVTQLEDIDYLSLDYNAILGYMYRGITQLAEANTLLKDRVSTLESFLLGKYPDEFHLTE